ncbi:auxin-responsive protein IAA26 isoform X3 [Lactuca sativa]|uniref:auxin-responsive protein IAA26 isoform X3 n=1 Tax=Lactuca sativa TaxID=4236 RepID=UPI0022AF1DAD|nr:auxin-responsive protein IAA26 isoform X3 [Lactuca sativa]
MLIPLWLALVIVWYISLKIQMEGYPKPNKVMIKEACEETRLELRLCPPGDGLYSIGTTHPTNSSSNTLMFKSSSKRVAQPPAVVGWPPVRSSRKNIMTSSYSNKINMDGVVIGRKVDLKAYDNYQSLSSAVDELFRGHLAARGDASSRITNKQKDATTVGLLEGNGEFTLVYEDNEGDRILVGDVPWDMFICSAKRLRVLKTCELSAFHL